MPVKAIICDFGGVLTSPLMDAFVAFQDETGITFEQLGAAMVRGQEQLGAHPSSSSSAGGSARRRSSTCCATASRPTSATGPSCTASPRPTWTRCIPTRR
ncbi:MAG: hypothetical protein R2700_10700 [Solirubrobacterales bacterium]